MAHPTLSGGGREASASAQFATMKKPIITTALVVASLGAIAGAVDVSSVTAKADGKGTDLGGRPVSFNVQLTDGAHTCGSGTLEAVVTNSRGTGLGCWRIIGDNVYLTNVLSLGMRDAMVPLSAFEGEGAAKLRGASNQSTALKPRASTIAAMQGGSGPSVNYAGRVRAAVRPNITYPDADAVVGNPAAEFEVNLASDGTIVGVKLSKSSGTPGWDEAAERALRRTDKIPRDTDGRIYTPMFISLRPKD